MPKAKYCKKCKRMVGIGCDCGKSFKERMHDRSFRMGDWAPARPSKWQPPKPKKGS